MKNLFLLLVLFVSSTSILNAQKLYSAEELNGPLLSEIFENAAMTTTNVNDAFLDVKSLYTYNVDIDPKKRYVTISAKYKLSDKATPETVTRLLNKLNKEVALIKAYTDDEFKTISYYYYFWTEGGFTAKSVISVTKLMDAALDLSLEKDTEGVL